ncbi:MAG TPA: formylglycine-generating enzyme family protein, partial [Planctomycetaceae bacterium]|nr:formylglycine-generating enzyme family protein [Planctomycetaceae bacterium]
PTVVLCGVLAAAIPTTFAAEPKASAEMKPYTEVIGGTEITFDLVPIPGGEFVMGSPAGEAERKDDEGPQHKVKIEPFWMGKTEMTWDVYDIWSYNLDIQRRKIEGKQPTDLDKIADGITRPTKPYTDMTFGMGQSGYPAICMTQHAAKKFCEWLSAKTGNYYRLPTEAEWEYACRAGTTTAYSFGDDPEQLGEFAWFFDNANEKYQKVGKKKPNPWGLYDMHGNVSEWCLDKYEPDFYAKTPAGKVADNPVVIPSKEYPRVARGGSWDDDPPTLRSAARIPSSLEWKQQDPQIPVSVWYMTDALHVGFRVVRPLRVPSPDERVAKHFNAILPIDAKEKANPVPNE